VPKTAIGTEIYVALNVERHLAAKITFDLEAIDDTSQLDEIFLMEVVGLDVEVDIPSRKTLRAVFRPMP